LAGTIFLMNSVRTEAYRVEFDSERALRTRNKLYYRISHWPLWIFVFLIAPGPLVFDLVESGFDERMAAWLGLVLIGAGVAGMAGKLPGCEPAPYIVRFTEDRPNPWYRRVCYTTAWGEIIAFAVLNVTGLAMAILTGRWYMEQLYRFGYFPLAGGIWALGLSGRLPRVKPSTAGEGHERRYFYGAVWAVGSAQSLLLLLWKVLPPGQGSTVIMLLSFLSVLRGAAWCARRGLLPRTRPILPGQLAISD
jgi:hypothetical protein